jgi:alginate O-acetyltransferase complex protein AlgJ
MAPGAERDLFAGTHRRLPVDSRSPTILPLLFLLLIFMPLADQVFHVASPAALNEKRALGKPPRFNMQAKFEFFKDYDAYYRDHFGFRGTLVRLHNLLTVRLFKLSPMANVIIGKKGWLFLARGDKLNNEIDYYRALSPLTDEQLQCFKTNLEQRRDWLARHGILYLFVVAPNKSSIYPEFMPAFVKKLHHQSRLDQIMEYMKKKSDLRILDLRPALLRAKKKWRVYHQTDSHWNDAGAYAAYCEICERLRDNFPDLRWQPAAAYTSSEMDAKGGDLAILLSLEENEFRERLISWEAKNPKQARPSLTPPLIGIPKWMRSKMATNPQGMLPTALMVHDSFIHELKPFLSEHFSKIYYIWDSRLHFLKACIEKLQPRIVIEETVERNLLNPLPINPRELQEQP